LSGLDITALEWARAYDGGRKAGWVRITGISNQNAGEARLLITDYRYLVTTTVVPMPTRW
jgi:hypothetical protein